MTVLVIGALTVGCSGPSSPAWPQDYSAVWSSTIADNVGDITNTVLEGPPVLMPFPSVDVKQVSLGIQGNYLYMKIDYNGVIPSANVFVPAQSGMPDQWVHNQGFSLDFDLDNNPATGANGIDIFFAVIVDYGQGVGAYANYDFRNNDLHLNQQQLAGEFGGGGLGFDYIIVRYNISGLGTLFSHGGTAPTLGWAEAESIGADNAVLYHHFAYDPIPNTTVTLP